MSGRTTPRTGCLRPQASSTSTSVPGSRGTRFAAATGAPAPSRRSPFLDGDCRRAASSSPAIPTTRACSRCARTSGGTRPSSPRDCGSSSRTPMIPSPPGRRRPPARPLNHLGHQRQLSDSSLPGVAPNVDTLYSLAWVDLAEEPFVLEAPDFGSRYYTFQFGFADTATELSLGARTHGARLPAIMITGPGDSTPVPPDMLHVGEHDSLPSDRRASPRAPCRPGRLRGGLRPAVADQAPAALPVPRRRGRV